VKDPFQPIVILALSFFFVFSVVTATQLGVFTDEAYFAAPAMRLAFGLPYFQHSAFAGTASYFGPPAIGQYVYAFPLSYLLAGVFGLFGASPSVLRAFFSLIHLATGAATYFGAKRLFGKRAAQITFIIFLIHPSLYAVTRDSPDTVFQVLLLELGFIAMLYEKPFLAGLLLGAGVNTKLSLLPPAVVMSAAVYLAHGDKRLRWIGLLGLGSVLGGMEALISNLYEPLLQVGAAFVRDELVELGNGMQERILRTALSAFSFFSGGSFEFSGIRLENLLSVPLVAISLIASLLPAQPDTRKACRLLCVMVTGSCVLLTLTPSKIEPRHFAYLFPFTCMIVTAAFVRFAATRYALIFASAFATACLWDLANSLGYIMALQRTGGTGLHSRQVTALANELLLRKPRKVVLLDWGVKDSLDFLARGKLSLVDNFEARNNIGELVKEEGNLYLALPRFHSRYSIESEFEEQAAKYGRKMVDELVIEDREGRLFAARRIAER